MVLPIYAYGHPVLKQVAQDVDPQDPKLPDLLANMWETMYFADGVGLAAPQIGLSSRIFVVDTLQIERKDSKEQPGIKSVFINAHKIEESGEPWEYEEGCLSIPNVRGDVERPERITLRYLDEEFQQQERTFTGINARVIQHEYDHIDGILFTEHLKPLRKRLIAGKLEKIKKGIVDTDYRMRFALRR